MKIAVTGLNATDNPGPGVPLIRSLKEAENLSPKLLGFIYDTLEPGIYMENMADKCYLIPYPSSGLSNLFDRILQINEKENIDLIIPCLDSELYGFVKLQDKLSDVGIKTFLPTVEQLNIRGKDKLYNFCEQNGIKMPKNILVHSVQELYSLPSDFEYPIVVKGIFYEAYIANNSEEALTAFNKLRHKWGYPIIIQQYLRGDEFNVAALGDGNGNTIGAVAMRKLYITDKGKGWAGTTIYEDTLLQTTYKVIEKTKWRSGLELEFIRRSDTGEYYLLEINPRFPAWIYLTVAAGQNLPAAFVKLAMGESVEPYKDYKIGTIFVRSSWDLITDMKQFEQISTFGEI
jgi:carbamoyl-phosphate synthase large subunit